MHTHQPRVERPYTPSEPVIGTANDVLPDLEGERECGDEDTRKRYVM